MGLFRHIATTTLVGFVIARIMSETTLQFGGENPLGPAPDGDNWHHEGITTKAADSAGWSREAGRSLAFHTDYVDSYLYNPLWWFDLTSGGGRDRFAAALSTRHELEKLHFDDLFTPEDIQATWDRYLGGTVAGLAWIAASHHPSRVQVSLAHNLVGASLHAIQDFYSHSNWIDEPKLRELTWFDVPDADRRRMSLWSGSYEKPDHLGVKPHGDFLFACTVVNNIGSVGRNLLRVACHAASPLAGSTFCQMLRTCDKAESVDVPPAWQAAVPSALRDDLVWVKPGVNLDSRWQAPMGVRERGLTDLTGDEAFESAYRLAVRTSCQWLRSLEATMAKANLGSFWREVQRVGVSEQDYRHDTAAFEDMGLVPYQFITAGPYPLAGGRARGGRYFLRLEISTADVLYAGTDADIVPSVDGVARPRLDHAKQAAVPEGGGYAEESLTDNILSNDDFERGSTAAYILGPFDSLPRTLALQNTGPDLGDLVLAAFEALGEAFMDFLKGIRGFFRALSGYHPDFVESDHHTFGPKDLNGLARGGSLPFELDCDGGSEGDYRITGDLQRLDQDDDEQMAAGGIAMRSYRVRFTKLHCDQESEWDRMTNSDEPFVLGLVIPLGGDDEMETWLGGPFDDVDSGETRTLDGSFVVRVPAGYGSISLAGAVYESDGESASERNQLLAEFAGHLDRGLEDPKESFLIQVAEALGSSWRPARIDAVAFTRDGQAPTMTPFRTIRPDGWIDGGTQARWDLDPRGEVTLPIIIPEDLDCPTASRPADVPTARLDELVISARNAKRPIAPRFDVSLVAGTTSSVGSTREPVGRSREEVFVRLGSTEWANVDRSPVPERLKERVDIDLPDTLKKRDDVLKGLRGRLRP